MAQAAIVCRIEIGAGKTFYGRNVKKRARRKRRNEDITMGAINEVLNKHVNLGAGPNEEELLSKLARLERSFERLFSELERPENIEIVRFAVEWEQLGLALKELQRKLHERLAEKPINKINQFLQQLKKKN
jgi:hypothetical protein